MRRPRKPELLLHKDGNPERSLGNSVDTNEYLLVRKLLEARKRLKRIRGNSAHPLT